MARLNARVRRPVVVGRVLTVSMLSWLILPAAPLSGQTTSPTETEPSNGLCRVYAAEEASGGPRVLRAGCRGVGLVLGRATEFKAIVNETLGATLVDIRLGSERRVLLLSFQADGQPLVEDLTGQIALAAGRGPMAAVGEVELDLERFTSTGEIGVRGQPEDTGSARTDAISVSNQMAQEHVRRGDGAAQH